MSPAVELLTCVLTALSLIFFGFGSARILPGMLSWFDPFGLHGTPDPGKDSSPIRMQPPAVVWFSVGILSLITLAGLLTEWRFPGVFVAEVVFWAVVIVGVRPALQGVIRISWKSSTQVLMLATGVFYTLFWLFQFKDNVSLPSYHDGVAHLSWLVDVHRTGFVYLSKVPVHFEKEFGRFLNPFYPTGMQGLMASVSGLWLRLGILPTTVLKAWLILTHTGLLLILIWALQRHWPNIPKYMLAVVALIACTAFRVPMDASTEGGLARLLAMAVVFPFCFYAATQDRFSLRQLALIGLGGFFAAFLLHPSAFWVFALTLGFAAGFEWKRQGFKWSKDVLYFGCACLTGAAMLGWLLFANRSSTTPLLIEQKYIGLSGLIDKLSYFFQILLAGTYAPRGVIRPLFHVGLVGVWWLAKQRALSVRVLMYHLMLLLFALLVMVSDVYRIPGSSIIGGAFYYEPARTACLLYLTVWIFVLASLPVFELAAKKVFSWIRIKNANSLVATAGPWIFVGLALTFQVANWFSTPRVMREFDTAFRTPKWKNLGDLAKFIEGNTPANALIVAAPFDADVLGPLTGRQSLFIYGDFVPGRDANAIARVNWFREKEKLINSLLSAPNNRTDCDSRTVVAPFNRPVVFILKDVQSVNGSEICKGLKYVGQINQRGVFVAQD